MDFLENLPFILGAVAIVVLQFFLRRRRNPQLSQQELVQNLLAETRLNIRMAEGFSYSRQPRQFLATTWQLNKDKLDFLDHSLQNKVSDAFVMVDDSNEQIAEAKRYKSTSYLSGIDIEKLRSVLTACKEGLEEWLLLKVGSKNPPERTPGMFDDLLGRR